LPLPGLSLGVLLLLWLSLLSGSPTLALNPTDAVPSNLENGSQVFSAQCAACHMGGGNVIRANRTLSQTDLQAHLAAYRSDHLEAIEEQVEHGNNAMPAFAGKLSEQDIADVAAFVEEQAERGWGR
jgi:cytochrome c6